MDAVTRTKRKPAAATTAQATGRGYPDLHDHIRTLDEAGLLVTVDRPINKDTEMHPLVRWQFRGGIEEKDRKAFLFTNVTDSKGRKYDIPVVVGALAANREIFRIGIGCSFQEIDARWLAAAQNPIAPRIVEKAPCHDIVITGKALDKPGNGLDGIPLPISTPGWDIAPYATLSQYITRDPDTGVQNMGNYRGQVKTRLARGIGAGAATAFYRQQTAALIRRLAGDRRWRLWLAVTPDRDRLARFWPMEMPRLAQGGGDLGKRMSRPLKLKAAGPVVIIGSDIPEIRARHIAKAFHLLAGHDAVFGPASDGGYWLVGIRRRPGTPQPYANVRWSSPAALADTLANLNGCRVAFVDELSDVDTPEDYRLWRWRG